MTVINLSDHRPGKKVAFRYQRGDICRALRLALEDSNSQPAQDIEDVFRGLIFETDEPDSDEARELIFQLLEAAANGKDKA